MFYLYVFHKSISFKLNVSLFQAYFLFSSCDFFHIICEIPYRQRLFWSPVPFFLHTLYLPTCSFNKKVEETKWRQHSTAWISLPIYFYSRRYKNIENTLQNPYFYLTFIIDTLSKNQLKLFFIKAPMNGTRHNIYLSIIKNKESVLPNKLRHHLKKLTLPIFSALQFVQVKPISTLNSQVAENQVEDRVELYSVSQKVQWRLVHKCKNNLQIV